MEVPTSLSSSKTPPSRWILTLLVVGSLAALVTCADPTPATRNDSIAPTTQSMVDPEKHDVVDKVKYLRVVTIEDKPFVFHFPFVAKEKQYTGLVIDILKEAVKVIGFDKVQISASYRSSYGWEENPDMWNGMIGELVNKSADIAVGAIHVTANRAKSVHFTQPFMQAGFRVLYKIPDAWYPSEAMVTLLRPFTPGLWVLIVLMFILVSLGLYLIGRYSPYEDIAFVGKTATYDGLTLPNSLLYAFSTLVWQGYTAAPKSISGRILICIWWVFGVFSVGAYIAGLCVILFKVNPEIRTLPFTTLDEMSRQSKVGIMVVNDSLTHNYLKTSKGKVESRLLALINSNSKHFLVGNTLDGISKMTMSDGRFALLMDGPIAEYESGQIPCDKMVIGEPLGHHAYAFACRSDSDVCNKMDEQIMKMKEDGRMNELIEKWLHGGCLDGKPKNYIFEGLPFFDTFGGEPDAIMPLTITVRRFSAAFILLMIGLALSGLCLLGEIYYAKKRGTAVPRKLDRSGRDDDMERIDNEFRDERADI